MECPHQAHTANAEPTPQSVAPRPIPRRKGHWLFGSAKDFFNDQRGFMLQAHAEFGDVFVTRMLNKDSYFVRDPEVVNAVNVTHANKFYKPAIVKQLWKHFMGNGLVPNDGESWKRQHKLIRPGFHKLRIDAYGETMSAYTQRMLRRWRPGERRDFRVDMVDLTLAIVGKTIFDADVEGDAKLVGEAMTHVSEVLVEQIQVPFPVPRWWPGPGNRRKHRAIADIESVIQRLIRERRADHKDRGDLLSHMVFSTDEEGHMSDKQLRDEAMTLIFAGHETTAHNLTWMWYLLATNPDKLALLRDEVDNALKGRTITIEDVPNLPYLEMCIKESLRLLPAVYAFAREATETVELHGYVFPKGALIAMSPYVMGRNEKYHPDPLEYKPERWTREYEKALPKGAYVPFAAGPRVCLGKQFAMMEMRMVMATLVQNVAFNVPEGFEPEFITELAMHPGPKGIPIDVRFRPDAPLLTSDSERSAAE